MSQNLSKYLKLLRQEASRFERTNINDEVDNRFTSKYLIKIVFLLISGILFYLLNNGFSESFISFVSSVLSILVGLFITALIFSFDKFYEPIDSENPDSRIKLWEKQAFNYAKTFAYITSYTIVLSIFTLVFLAVSALFPKETGLDIFKLSFGIDCINSLKIFTLASLVLIQRILVIYWLLRITYNTLFIVSSMVQYMTTKIDRTK